MRRVQIAAVVVRPDDVAGALAGLTAQVCGALTALPGAQLTWLQSPMGEREVLLTVVVDFYMMGGGDGSKTKAATAGGEDAGGGGDGVDAG